jgi:hypothetical protein
MFTRLHTALAAVLFTLSIMSLSAEQFFTYKSNAGGEEYTYRIHIGENAGFSTISGESPAAAWKLVCGPNGETIAYEYRSEIDGADYLLERKNGFILARGTLKENDINKQIKIDKDLPWFQTLGVSFSIFVLSESKRMEFTMLRPADLKVLKWVIKKQGDEVIEINEKPVDAIRVKLNLAGILAPLWSGDLWFRRTDGQYLKFQGGSFTPGKPETVIELVEEPS